MQIVQKKLNSLIPYVRNPRKNDAAVKGVAASIKEFGFQQPIVIDRDSVVVAGHTRLKAAESLGLKEVPCVIADDLTPQQIKAYRLLDNKLNERAEWDSELLPLELGELADFDLAPFDVEWGLDEFGTADTADDTIPEPPKDPVTKPGDVWKLGEHRVFCQDQALAQIPKCRLVFTSPPYSDLRSYEGDCDLSVEHLSKFFRTIEADYFVVNLGLKFKDRAVVPYWDDWNKAAAEAGLKMLAWNVWDKTQAGSVAHATNMFSITHEWLFVFGAEGGKLNRTIPNDQAAYESRHGANWRSGGHRSVRQQDGSFVRTSTATYTHHQLHSVLQQTPELGPIRGEHPATMPIGLPLKYLEAMTDKCDAVCDPFLGSGTMLIAAERTGRVCYGTEISPQYCDVICQRYFNETGEVATLEADDSPFPVAHEK